MKSSIMKNEERLDQIGEEINNMWGRIEDIQNGKISIEEASKNVKTLSDDLVPRFKKLLKEKITIGEAAKKVERFNSLIDASIERISSGDVVITTRE